MRAPCSPVEGTFWGRCFSTSSPQPCKGKGTRDAEVGPAPGHDWWSGSLTMAVGLRGHTGPVRAGREGTPGSKRPSSFLPQEVGLALLVSLLPALVP